MDYGDVLKFAKKYVRKNPPEEFCQGEFFQELLRCGLGPDDLDEPDWRGIAGALGLNQVACESLIEGFANWMGDPA